MKLFKLRPWGDLFYYFAIVLVLAASFYPCIIIIKNNWQLKDGNGIQIFLLALIIGACYLLCGAILLSTTVLIRICFIPKLTRVSHKINSKHSANFSVYHSLINICNHFYLGLIRSTLLLNIYYRLMGATIGKRTIINTTRISDCENIFIGNDCVIGGDVILNGHSAEGDMLYKGKITIGNNVTIGQYTTILPNVRIGDNVIIGANSLVPKNAVLEKNAIYGGVPAVKLKATPTQDKLVRKTFQGKSKDETMDLDPTTRNEILMKSYELRHSEILKIESFMQNVMVTSLGLIFTILTYAILENKPKMLLLLPVLAGLSYAIFINLTTTMLKNAYYMIMIELHFKKSNLENFDWEINEGIFGKSRSLSLDNLLINLIYIITYLAGLVLTYNDRIVKPEESMFLNSPLKYQMLVIDLFLLVWIIFSLVFYLLKRRSYLRAIRSL